MLKFLVVTGTSLGMLTATVAADLPRAQPVYQQAQVGKGAPIGKAPVGKGPVGAGADCNEGLIRHHRGRAMHRIALLARPGLRPLKLPPKLAGFGKSSR